MSVAEVEATSSSSSAPSGLWSEARYRLIRNPGAIIGAFFVSIFVIVAIFAPLIAPYGPEDRTSTCSTAGDLPGRRPTTGSASTCSGGTCSRASSTARATRC